MPRDLLKTVIAEELRKKCTNLTKQDKELASKVLTMTERKQSNKDTTPIHCM